MLVLWRTSPLDWTFLRQRTFIGIAVDRSRRRINDLYLSEQYNEQIRLTAAEYLALHLAVGL